MVRGPVPRIPRSAIGLSLAVITLCLAGAAYLYHQQAAELGVLQLKRANYTSTRTLESQVDELAALLEAGADEQVGAQHGRVRQLLDRAGEVADPGQEVAWVAELRARFDEHVRAWEGRPGAGGRTPAADLVRQVRGGMLPICRRLEDSDFAQVDESEKALAGSMQAMAWGLGLVGVVGSVSALLLGYNMARGLRSSLHRLSVHVRAASEKLGRTLPTVTITETGDFERVHEQVRGLMGEIETVVGRLQQREREVLRAEQLAAVGQLAAGVAHELRNPLTSIKMLVQAQREEAEAGGLPADDLSVIEQEIRRMERSLQNFLDFARPPRPHRRPLDLAGAVRRTLALVGGRARKQQVAVCFTPPAPPLVVDADAEQVQQLLVNLALNALDVMPDGGTLRVEAGPAAGGDVEIRVLDTGPGIPPELAPRLFEPFVSGKETGLGLGLVIARRIAETHGGGVWAVNRPEGGACLTLRLPARAPNGAARD